MNFGYYQATKAFSDVKGNSEEQGEFSWFLGFLFSNNNMEMEMDFSYPGLVYSSPVNTPQIQRKKSCGI